MTIKFRQIWDFILGIVVIGAAPLLTLAAVLFVSGHYIGGSVGMNTFAQKMVMALSFSAFVVAPLAALLLAIRWRLRHRILSIWVIWLEIPIGLLAAAIFFFALLICWASAADL